MQELSDSEKGKKQIEAAIVVAMVILILGLFFSHLVNSHNRSNERDAIEALAEGGDNSFLPFLK